MSLAATVTEPGFTEQLLDVLPRVGMVLAAIVVGLIVAFIARRAARWLVRKTGLETLGERLGVSRVLYAIGARGSLAHLVGTVVFVAVILTTFAVVAEMLELPGLSDGVRAIAGYLPRLFAAAAIVIAGLYVADLVRRIVARARGDGEAASIDSPQLLPRGLHAAIATVAVVMALGQLGLETRLIDMLIVIVVATGGLSVGLAFALGAQHVVRNVFARHYLQSLCAPGDTVEIDGVTGIVQRFTATTMVVRSESGLRCVPCHHALSSVLRVVVRSDSGAREP